MINANEDDSRPMTNLLLEASSSCDENGVYLGQNVSMMEEQQFENSLGVGSESCQEIPSVVEPCQVLPGLNHEEYLESNVDNSWLIEDNLDEVFDETLQNFNIDTWNGEEILDFENLCEDKMS
jgi:hypothetical protein